VLSQAHVRWANERAREGDVRYSPPLRSLRSDFAVYRCECGSNGCEAIVELPLAEYEHVRAHPERFLVAPGHDQHEVDRVVFTGARYVVVETDGEAAEIARDLDPRAPGAEPPDEE
jgi:hypothetical protein